MDIADRIGRALDRMQAENRKPIRLLIGHREAAELDVLLRPHLRPPPPDDEPLLPFPLAQAVTFMGVSVERVDQPSLIGVIGEECS